MSKQQQYYLVIITQTYYIFIYKIIIYNFYCYNRHKCYGNPYAYIDKLITKSNNNNNTNNNI